MRLLIAATLQGKATRDSSVKIFMTCIAPGTTKSWDTAGLMRFCDTLRRTENADTAEAIMQYMKHGERAGYFRVAAIRERNGT